MTAELFDKVIREALRETLPGNDNGGGAAIRIEHSGTITVRIEVATAPADAAPRRQQPLRVASESVVEQLLADLDARKPVGQTWEREEKRAVTNPSPYQRALVGGRQLR